MTIVTNPIVNGDPTSGSGSGSGGIGGGSFVLGTVDSFGRITSYAKAGIAYTIAYSNGAAKQPTNYTITKVSDGLVQNTGSIDSNGYPTVIV